MGQYSIPGLSDASIDLTCVDALWYSNQWQLAHKDSRTGLIIIIIRVNNINNNKDLSYIFSAAEYLCSRVVE